jgi:hypothetical protein
VTARLTINGVDFTSKWRLYESRWTTRAYMGESSQSEFVLDDDLNDFDHADLASRKIVEVWEDASGVDTCMYRGRVANKSLGRGPSLPEDRMQWTVIAEDSNIDVRGIRVDESTRPAESDRERVLAYLAGYLNGASSTNPNARDSTDIDGTYVVAADLVALPAETYTDTFPGDVFNRITEVSAKTWFVYTDGDGQMHLYYASHTDQTLVSDISITDNELDADGEDVYSPYLGTATGEHDGQQIISGGSLRYGNEQFYEYSHAGSEDDHDKWEEHFTDSVVINQGSAESFLENVVASRNNEDFRYIVTIRMRVEEAHRIRAGMYVPLRLASANLTTESDQRAVQVQHEPLNDDWYLVNIEFGVPRGRPFRRNLRTKPLFTPSQPTEGTAPQLEDFAILASDTVEDIEIQSTGDDSALYVAVLGPNAPTLTWYPHRVNFGTPGSGQGISTLVEDGTAGSYTLRVYRRAGIVASSVSTSAVRIEVGAGERFIIAVWSVYGVDQTTPEANVAEANNVASSTSSVTVTGTSENLILDVVAWAAANATVTNPIHTGSNTQDGSDSIDRSSGFVDLALGASHGSDTTPSWNLTNTHSWREIAIAVAPSDAGSAGDETEPVAGTGSIGTGSTVALGNHTHEARTIVRKNSTGSEIIERRLNLIEGSGITLTVADDTTDDEVDVTIASTGGAPTTADYLVGTANGSLSAEIVVGTSPGGELGGTWASPTVDATHSGSAHTDFIAKAIVDAKGDLIAATAADTVARVAVGTNGQVLTADSTAAAGVSWASSSSGTHYEVLLTEDGTEPLTTEDGLDWLYVEVAN